MSGFRRLDNRDIQRIEQKYQIYFADEKHVHKDVLRNMLFRRHCILGLIIISLYVPGFIFNTAVEITEPGEQTADPVGAALIDKINPNIAPWFALTVLPEIGPSRAYAIVRYRQRNSGIGERLFQTADDLDNVPSIGPATINACKEYLYFQ